MDYRDPAAQSVNVDAIRNLKNMGHVVADEHDRQSAPLKIRHEFENFSRFLHTERSRRFIHNHDPAAECRRSRHGDALALTARQCLDRLIDVLNRHQAKG